MNYKKIVVAGGGILGSQIAFQTAYCGYEVVILVREEDSKDGIIEKLKKLNDTYIKAIELMSTKDGKDPSKGCKGRDQGRDDP